MILGAVLFFIQKGTILLSGKGANTIFEENLFKLNPLVHWFQISPTAVGASRPAQVTRVNKSQVSPNDYKGFSTNRPQAINKQMAATTSQ